MGVNRISIMTACLDQQISITSESRIRYNQLLLWVELKNIKDKVEYVVGILALSNDKFSNFISRSRK